MRNSNARNRFLKNENVADHNPGFRNLRWPAYALILAFLLDAQVVEAQTGIAARVGDESIRIERLKLQVDLVLAKTPAKGIKLDVIKAQVLEENIKQRLVNVYLQKSKFKAQESEIELELSDVTKDLVAQKKTLTDLYKARGINEAQLRESLAWDISWGKYLDSYLTDGNLKKYFEKHRTKMDGTQIHVAHILIKPIDKNESDSWKKAYDKATRIRKELASQKISFEEAVIQHSSGATKINKGDLGWIGWYGPMTRSFTDAAFQLKTGEISPPVQTTFGFHLIKLVEIKPGKKDFEELRPQVVQSVKRYLFEWLANRQAKESKVEFTGEFPYFEWGTKRFGKFKKS